MHSILWASILASAGVALVVTLVVEYLAKPGLEARKDRILEDRRLQRNALRDIRRCTLLASELYVYGRLADAGPDDGINVAIKEKALKTAAELEELVINSTKVIKMPPWMQKEYIKVVATIAGFSYTFCAKGSLATATWEQFHRENTRLSYFVTLLTTSNRHPLRKRGMTIKSSPLPSYRKDSASEADNSLSSNRESGKEPCP